MGLFGKTFYCMYFSRRNFTQHFDKPLFFHFILLYLHKQIQITLMANACNCLKSNFYKPCYNFSVKDKIPLVSKLQKVLLYNINTYFFQVKEKEYKYSSHINRRQFYQTTLSIYFFLNFKTCHLFKRKEGP